MRHQRKTVKLQRTQSHRDALLNNLCKSLVEHRRIRTTLAKAKALRPVAEKLLTLGKKSLAAEGKDAKEVAAKRVHFARQAFATLRDKTLVKKLFDEIAVASKDRQGGYTRITKLGQRHSDSASMAFIEWVDSYVSKSESSADATEAVVVAPAKTEKAEKAEKPAKTKKTETKEDSAE